PRRAGVAVAATPGSFRTTPSRGATRTVRTLRRFHRGCPTPACAATACRGSASWPTRSWAWAAPQSPALCLALTSWESSSIGAISTRRSIGRDARSTARHTGVPGRAASRRDRLLSRLRLRRRLQRIRLPRPDIEVRTVGLDLDPARPLHYVRVARVVAKHVVIAAFGIDPLQGLVEVVLIDRGESAGLLRDHPQAVLRFAEVIVPLGRIDLFVDVGPGHEPARVNRVKRRVGAVGGARQLRRVP